VTGRDCISPVETAAAGRSGRLADLHAAYTFKVNAAVAEDRSDLVTALASAFDEAQTLLA
jgi:hypothetical protein